MKFGWQRRKDSGRRRTEEAAVAIWTVNRDHTPRQPLQFGKGVGQIPAGGVDLLGLVVELSLYLLPTQIFDA